MLIEIFVFGDTSTLDHIIHSHYILYVKTFLIYCLQKPSSFFSLSTISEKKKRTIKIALLYPHIGGFPGGSDGKESPCIAEDLV